MNPSRDQIEKLIRACADVHGIDADLLIRQCAAESGFRQFDQAGNLLTSPCGAVGLFQLMPATAHMLRVNPARWTENVAGGIKYMGALMSKYGNDAAKALAAYNWGPGNMDRLLRDHPAGWRERLPKETRAYLDKILA